MTIWLSSSACARAGVSADEVLALTGTPSPVPPAEDDVQLVTMGGAPTVIFAGVETDRYLRMWAQMNGRTSRESTE